LPETRLEWSLLFPVALASMAAILDAAAADCDPALDPAVYLYALEANLLWLWLASGLPS
jgi:hypothetical protein